MGSQLARSWAHIASQSLLPPGRARRRAVSRVGAYSLIACQLFAPSGRARWKRGRFKIDQCYATTDQRSFNSRTGGDLKSATISRWANCLTASNKVVCLLHIHHVSYLLIGGYTLAPALPSQFSDRLAKIGVERSSDWHFSDFRSSVCSGAKHTTTLRRSSKVHTADNRLKTIEQ